MSSPGSRLTSAALLLGAVVSAKLTAGDQFGLPVFGLSVIPVWPFLPFLGDDGALVGFAFLLWGVAFIAAGFSGLALFGATALGWVAVMLLPHASSRWAAGDGPRSRPPPSASPCSWGSRWCASAEWK